MIPLHWHTEPTLLLSLLFSGWLYALLTGPLRNRIAPGAPATPGRSLAFYAGLALIYCAVGSPLDQLGEDFLFAAHMLQHELIIYPIPLLIYAGMPHWLVDAVLRHRRIRGLISLLAQPAIGATLFTLCFSLWHVPAFYVAALQSKSIHVLEHVSLFITALMVWWSFLSPSRLLPAKQHGVQLLLVFVLMVGQLPLFGFLSFASEVLYLPYAYAPRLAFFDISPLSDQILGGVVMKVCNMIVSLSLLGWIFYRWQKASE